MRRLKIAKGSAFVTGVMAVLLTFANSAFGAVSPSALTPKHGGTLNIIVGPGAGQTWTSFDPIVTGTNVDMDNDVYGELFTDGTNNAIAPSIATGYQIANKNLLVKVNLHKNIKFSDGTPLNAAAVIWNWQRDLLPANACSCLTNFKSVSSVYAVGNYQADLVLSYSFAPLIAAFVGSALDHIISPTAFAADGNSSSSYGQRPIGAGPFLVQSVVASTTATLIRNSGYFDQPEPYLNEITYANVGADASAIAALQAGQDQAAVNVTTPNIIAGAKAQFNVVPLPAQATWSMFFDTFRAPMSNLLAREAVEYATNAPLIDKQLFNNIYKPVESPATSGDLFYTPVVPGYRKYDLSKATSLVHQLGGLSFNVLVGSQTQEIDAIEAFEQSWTAAGMNPNCTCGGLSLSTLLSTIAAHNYDVSIITSAGGYDDSISLTSSFSCGGAETSVCDPKLQVYFRQGQGLTNQTARATAMRNLFDYMNKEAYIDTLFTAQTYIITQKNVENVKQGTTTLWYAAVWLKQ